MGGSGWCKDEGHPVASGQRGRRHGGAEDEWGARHRRSLSGDRLPRAKIGARGHGVIHRQLVHAVGDVGVLEDAEGGRHVTRLGTESDDRRTDGVTKSHLARRRRQEGGARRHQGRPRGDEEGGLAHEQDRRHPGADAEATGSPRQVSSPAVAGCQCHGAGDRQPEDDLHRRPHKAPGPDGSFRRRQSAAAENPYRRHHQPRHRESARRPGAHRALAPGAHEHVGPHTGEHGDGEGHFDDRPVPRHTLTAGDVVDQRDHRRRECHHSRDHDHRPEGEHLGLSPRATNAVTPSTSAITPTYAAVSG